MASKRMHLGSIGSTGLRQSGGYIDEEFLLRLRGQNGIKLYKEMSQNNSVIGSILYIIDMIVRQVEWRVETPPGMSKDPKAIEQKEFLKGAMSDMDHTWEGFISEALSMLVFGWAFFEITYKVRKGDQTSPKRSSDFDDGKLGWRKIEIRSQDTLDKWKFDDEGDLEGLVQYDFSLPQGGGPVFIPMEKSLLLRTRSIKGNPEGLSLLRPAVRDWFFLKRIQEIEAIGIERDLAGMPIFEVPRELLMEDASASDKALLGQLKDMVQQIRVDERFGGVIPSELDREGKPTGFKFRLQTSGGKRAIDTDAIIKRYESRMAMVFLAEFIMIGMDRVGAKSADESKKSMFKTSLEAVLSDMLAGPFNKEAIGKLMKLNGVPKKYWPRVVPAAITSPDLDKMGKFLQAMSLSGVLTPNRTLEAKLLQDARLPEPPEEETELFESARQDQAPAVMSADQLEAVMQINAAVTSGGLSREAGVNLVAGALGQSPKSVERYVTEEPEEIEEPAEVPEELEVDEVVPDAEE